LKARYHFAVIFLILGPILLPHRKENILKLIHRNILQWQLLHSALGYLSPVEFEENIINEIKECVA